MAERGLFIKDGKHVALPVAAATIIELGNMVAVNAAGYLIPATDTTGLKLVGIASETADNSNGAAGDMTVRVMRDQSFLLENSGLTQANVGANVYVADGVTVKASGNVVAGKLLAVTDPDGVQVWIS